MTSAGFGIRSVLVAPMGVVRLHTPDGALRGQADSWDLGFAYPSSGSGLTSAVASGYGERNLGGRSANGSAGRGRVHPSARIEGGQVRQRGKETRSGPIPDGGPEEVAGET